MGRPPKGKRAMTVAERSRLYRARHPRAHHPPPAAPQPPDPASVEELAQAKKELAAARARISELEQGGGGGRIIRAEHLALDPVQVIRWLRREYGPKPLSSSARRPMRSCARRPQAGTSFDRVRIACRVRGGHGEISPAESQSAVHGAAGAL